MTQPGLPPDSTDAAVSTRQGPPVLGIVLTVVLVCIAIALFTWIIVRMGGVEGSYYNNLMERSQFKQEHSAPR